MIRAKHALAAVAVCGLCQFAQTAPAELVGEYVGTTRFTTYDLAAGQKPLKRKSEMRILIYPNTGFMVQYQRLIEATDNNLTQGEAVFGIEQGGLVAKYPGALFTATMQLEKNGRMKGKFSLGDNLNSGAIMDEGSFVVRKVQP